MVKDFRLDVVGYPAIVLKVVLAKPSGPLTLKHEPDKRFAAPFAKTAPNKKASVLYRRAANHFLSWMVDKQIDPKNLNINIVKDYYNFLVQIYSASYSMTMFVIVKNFCVFLFQKEVVSVDLADVIDNFIQKSNKTINKLKL